MKFLYVKLGRARIVPGDQHDGPGDLIDPPNWIFGVKLDRGDLPGVVLGAVQENPCVPGEWRAVPAMGDAYPAVDFRQGLWPLTPGRSGFRTRKEAATWLLGVHDTQQTWFQYAVTQD